LNWVVDIPGSSQLFQDSTVFAVIYDARSGVLPYGTNQGEATEPVPQDAL